MKKSHTKTPINNGLNLYPALKWAVYIAMFCTVVATILYPFHRAAMATANPVLINSVLSDFAVLAVSIKFMVLLFAFIVFLKWLFFAMVNYQAASVSFSPTAAVMWLLVPVLNLAVALLIMLNLGKSSFAANGWSVRKIILITLLWWVTAVYWLADIKHPVDLYQEAAPTIVSFTPVLTTSGVLNYLAFFVAALLFLFIVRSINQALVIHLERSLA